MTNSESSTTAVLLSFPRAKPGCPHDKTGVQTDIRTIGDREHRDEAPETVRFETERVRHNMIYELLQAQEFLAKLQRSGFDSPQASAEVSKLEADLRAYNEQVQPPKGTNICYRDMPSDEADRFSLLSDNATMLARRLRQASMHEDDRIKLTELVDELAKMLPAPRFLFTTRKNATNPITVRMIDFVGNAQSRLAEYRVWLEQMHAAISELRVHDADSIKEQFDDLYRLHTAAKQGFVGFFEVLPGGKDKNQS